MTELHNADEGRRQAYLAALGIPLWSSRHDLPGAAPSTGLAYAAFVDLNASEPAPVLAQEPVREQPVATTRPPAGPYDAARHEPPRHDVREPSSPAAPVPARPAAAINPAFPRFACRVELLAPGWLAVIALDDVPDLSAQEYRLLGNLVQALGGDGAAESAREHFRFPVSPNPAIPRDAAAAREALAAFLGRRREATRWLVLGQTLAAYVRGALPPAHTVVAAATLRELLESPAAKRALWQALHA
jgi:hypothetical protein